LDCPGGLERGLNAGFKRHFYGLIAALASAKKEPHIMCERGESFLELVVINEHKFCVFAIPQSLCGVSEYFFFLKICYLAA
jgi:hypothetical protein